VSKSEVSELTASVARLKGYKDKLEQAGELKRLLQEKDEEAETLIEQLVEKEAESDSHQRLAEVIAWVWVWVWVWVCWHALLLHTQI